MAKLTLTDIVTGYFTATAYNANNTLIETALENTLSRDGTAPNTMSANLDMNSNKITNVTDGTNNQDAVTVAQLTAASLASIAELVDLSDVVSATNTNRFALMANGTTGYVGRALVEADISDLQSYLVNVVEDTTPQLGGDLDTNGNDIIFVDDAYITMGTTDDLRFYYAGGTSVGHINVRNLGETLSIDEAGVAKFIFDHGTNVLDIRDGNALRIRDAGDTDWVDFSHDGTDFTIAGTNTTNLNLTGLTAIAAGTVDADFDAITGTSYGGITEANLLDKTAVETVSGAWTHSASLTMTAQLAMGAGNAIRVLNPADTTWVDVSVDATPDLNIASTSVVDMNITGFTAINAGTVDADFDALTATSYGGITEANLLDKTATETVSGAYTFTGGATFTTSNIVAGTVDADFDAVTATSYGGITEANLLDKSAVETISGIYTFSASPVISSGSLFIDEGSADEASQAGKGQFWVQDDAPNRPYFTDDGDTAYPLSFAKWNNVSEDVSDTVDWQYMNGIGFKDGTGAITYTLEASGVTTFEVGSNCTFMNAGSSADININEGTGTTLYLLDGSTVTDTAGGCTLAPGGYATVYRHSATVYYVMGAGLTA